MKSESDEMKKRLGNQIAEDFYSRFESNEEKLLRLRKMQEGEVSLPTGLEVEDEVSLPHVGQMHDMLLNGVKDSAGITGIPVPETTGRTATVEKDTEETTYR